MSARGALLFEVVGGKAIRMLFRTPPEGLDAARQRMVHQQIQARGITNPRILEAFGKVPRHAFVSEAQLAKAYEDYPLAIGESQTISQPYMVAVMTRELNPQAQEKILEIGTGSGYQTAILAELAGHVWSLERIPVLAEAARERLAALGYRNITLLEGDGTKGYAEAAPYDGILVTAAAPNVPQPLLNQLAVNGKLVIPVGGIYSQELIVAVRRETGIEQYQRGGCVFVKLIGEHGWSNEHQR